MRNRSVHVTAGLLATLLSSTCLAQVNVNAPQAPVPAPAMAPPVNPDGTRSTTTWARGDDGGHTRASATYDGDREVSRETTSYDRDGRLTY